jgi:predicted phage terminase large subunit-like protein
LKDEHTVHFFHGFSTRQNVLFAFRSVPSCTGRSAKPNDDVDFSHLKRCGRLLGVDPEWRIYVLDRWRAQTSSEKWIETFCDLVLQWKPIGWAEEQGQIRAGVGPFLERRMRERAAYVARAQFPTRGDKAVRAQSIRGRMELDGLHVPMRAPWYANFRAELLSFPAGKHDDQVDALGLIGQVLNKMTGGALPKPPEKVRYMNGMTMDEAWDLARPKRPGADARI